MKGYCNEDARNLIGLEIQNRKEALTLYPEIIKVVEQFNGKVLNKRFDTALKKVNKRLGYDRGYSSFVINLSTYDNNCCQSVNGSNYIYIRSHYIELNTYLPTYSVDRRESSLLENERIKSDILIESLLKGKTHLEESIKKLEQSIDKVDEWKARLEQLEAEMKNIRKEIPHLVADYYGIY